MLRFRVFSDGKVAEHLDLSAAYLVGSDGVPVRAEIEFSNGEIVCKKRVGGPVGLALLWPVPGFGRVMLETTRLQERDQPYILQLELARSRLMRLSHKQEDWELEDPDSLKTLNDKVAQARDRLIDALQADDEPTAARLSDEALALAVKAGEGLSLKHAETALIRKRAENGFARRLLGCTIDLNNTSDAYRKQLLGAVDFVALPFCWRQIEPVEQKFEWDALDNWVEWLTKHRIPMKGSALVCFAEANVPDWLYIWEHDFETIRDMVYEHVRRVLTRYGQSIQVWDVVSGIHAVNAISFNFEQLMELTRMAASLTKQMLPKSLAILDLVAPWGEYYARNQRTIPPMLYADMAIQSGINFDAFGLQCYFGLGADGMHVRDMFQISSMIDQFTARGKPVHITGVQVPSGLTVDKGDAWKGALSVADGGNWWAEWSEDLQSKWLRFFYEIALSKPMVDTITWRDLADAPPNYLPHGGLLRADLSPKPAYKQLQTIRKSVVKNGK